MIYIYMFIYMYMLYDNVNLYVYDNVYVYAYVLANENCPFMVDLPIKHSDFKHSSVNVYGVTEGNVPTNLRTVPIHLRLVVLKIGKLQRAKVDGNCSELL